MMLLVNLSSSNEGGNTTGEHNDTYRTQWHEYSSDNRRKGALQSKGQSNDIVGE